MPGNKTMLSGTIRRMDDLGRIAVPRELRRKLGLVDGTPVEQVLTPDGILLRPYYAYDDLDKLLTACENLVVDNKGQYPDKSDYELLVGLIKQSRRIVREAARAAELNGSSGRA